MIGGRRHRFFQGLENLAGKFPRLGTLCRIFSKPWNFSGFRCASAGRRARFGAVQAMKFSIVIPARNESAYLAACLEAVAVAARPYAGTTEVIVVLNRCTDDTGAIARRHGAQVVHDDSRNLAKIRNAGARQARGEFLVTIDADSRMSPNMLTEIERKLASGKYIGGGVPIRPERRSLGVILTGLVIFSLLRFRISAGLFWCRRAAFNAIGGFNEALVIAEDIDFAHRLKAHGRKSGLRFGTLWRTQIITSCRKFDHFGDWFMLKHPRALWRALHGVDSGQADDVFYDFKR
jgi:glycosyltransferase involved in cell wall biosynthesis